jgi:hypothetical protein
LLFAAGWVLLLAITYTFSWQALANHWRADIAAWAKAQAGAGWTVATGAIATSGFPGPIRLTLAQPSAADAAGDAWQGPPVTVTFDPWHPGKPRFAGPGAQRFAFAGHPGIEIDAQSLDGTITLADGQPAELDLTARSVAAGDVTLEGLTVELRRPPAEPDATVPTRLAAAIGLDRLTVPKGTANLLDPTIATAHLALRLRGPWPAGTHADALTAWRDGGGTIELDSFDFDWPPLAAAGDATVALDATLQPELAGTVTVRGGAAVIDRAAQAGMMDKDGANIAKLALLLASKPAGDGTGAAKLAVSVQKRVLSVGPVPLLQLPEVTW